MRKPSNILDEWNGYLEIFSFSQALEISRQYCFFQQLFYSMKSLGAPEVDHTCQKLPCSHFQVSRGRTSIASFYHVTRFYKSSHVLCRYGNDVQDIVYRTQVFSKNCLDGLNYTIP